MQSLQHFKNKPEDTIDIMRWHESDMIKSLSNLLSCNSPQLVAPQKTFLQEFHI